MIRLCCSRLVLPRVPTRSMSSFNIQLNNLSVPVKIPEHCNVTPEQLQQFRPFKSWTDNLARSLQDYDGYEFNGVNIQSVDWFGGKRLGFVKLEADMIHPTGKKLPGVTFLRGGSVAMLVILEAEHTGNRYVILTSQPRVASGHLQLLELPAGMIDDGTFRGAAAKEIEEECGFSIPENELVELSKMPVFTSPGGIDETMSFFTYTKRMPQSEIDELNGKLTGNLNESEAITLKIVPYDKIMEYQQDGKLLMALALYNSSSK